MLLGARQMWRGKTASYPWDYRVKYVESVNCAAYFRIFDALPNLSTTPNAFDASWEDLWEIVMGVPVVDNTDKHLAGRPYTWGLAQYGGRWRPTYYNEWTTGLNIPVSTYNPVMFRAENGKMTCWTSDGSTKIWERTGNIFVRIPDKSWTLARLTIGAMVEDDGTPKPSRFRATNHVYSFRRVCQNVPEAVLIPCVKDGVPCFYDEVSGAFCASTSGTPFVAGPRVNDDGTDIT